MDVAILGVMYVFKVKKSPSATVWKSAQKFKAESGQNIGVAPDAFGRFFCVQK